MFPDALMSLLSSCLLSSTWKSVFYTIRFWLPKCWLFVPPQDYQNKFRMLIFFKHKALLHWRTCRASSHSWVFFKGFQMTLGWSLKLQPIKLKGSNYKWLLSYFAECEIILHWTVCSLFLHSPPFTRCLWRRFLTMIPVKTKPSHARRLDWLSRKVPFSR